MKQPDAKVFVYRGVEEPDVVLRTTQENVVQAVIHERNGCKEVIFFAVRSGILKNWADEVSDLANPRIVQMALDAGLTDLTAAAERLEALAAALKFKVGVVDDDDLARGLLYNLAERMREQLAAIDKWVEENDA